MLTLKYKSDIEIGPFIINLRSSGEQLEIISNCISRLTAGKKSPTFHHFFKESAIPDLRANSIFLIITLFLTPISGIPAYTCFRNSIVNSDNDREAR